MLKVFKIVLLPIFIFLLSWFSFGLSGACLFNNESKDINRYLAGLVSSKYESFIFKSNGNIQKENINDDYLKDIETQIGYYSPNKSCEINNNVFNGTIIKSHIYKNETIYNNFGVYCHVNSSKNNSWNTMTNNNVFISNILANKLKDEFDTNFDSVLNKRIIIEEDEFFVGGIYFCQKNSSSANESQSKGNVFDGTFGNAIFMSDEFESGFDFYNLLFLNKKSKIKHSDAFNYFYDLISSDGGYVYSSATIYDDVIDNHTDERIISIKNFNNEIKCKIIGPLFSVFGTVFIIIACYLTFKSFRFEKKQLYYLLYLFFILVFYFLSLFVITLMSLKTHMGVSISCNTRYSIIINIISLVFGIGLFWKISKNNKNLIISKANQNKQFYEISI